MISALCWSAEDGFSVTSLWLKIKHDKIPFSNPYPFNLIK